MPEHVNTVYTGHSTQTANSANDIFVLALHTAGSCQQHTAQIKDAQTHTVDPWTENTGLRSRHAAPAGTQSCHVLMTCNHKSGATFWPAPKPQLSAATTKPSSVLAAAPLLARQPPPTPHGHAYLPQSCCSAWYDAAAAAWHQAGQRRMQSNTEPLQAATVQSPWLTTCQPSQQAAKSNLPQHTLHSMLSQTAVKPPLPARRMPRQCIQLPAPLAPYTEQSSPQPIIIKHISCPTCPCGTHTHAHTHVHPTPAQAAPACAVCCSA